MNAPTIPVTDNVADLDSGTTENEFPNGDDLAISRATDFYSLDELLTDREREVRDRVRLWCDTEVAPAAADYWERAEFPVELAKGYGRLGIAGASIVGNGCPGMSFLAEGVIAARTGPRRWQHRHSQRRTFRARDDDHSDARLRRAAGPISATDGDL
jgi:alkylation response protein AidB-like acyl-CoA dehydrogenase